MGLPDFKNLYKEEPKWFDLPKKYWKIVLIELAISLVLSVLSSGRPEFPFIRLNLDSPYGPILVTIVGLIIFAKPATAVVEKLECWTMEGSCSERYEGGIDLLGISGNTPKATPSYHDKIVIASIVIMVAVLLLDALRLGLTEWIGFLGHLSSYVKEHAPWAFYVRVILSLLYYGILVWIYAYWASFVAYFFGYLSLIRSLNPSNITPLAELRKLATPEKVSCLATSSECIQSLTSIAEDFVELRGTIKEMFRPGLSVASSLLAVSVLSAVYVLVAKYTSNPENEAGLISGWGFLLISLVLFGVLMHLASSVVSSMKEETVAYVHKIRIGLINAGGNQKAYELLDEIERALETVKAIPLESNELIELVSIAISVILTLLTGSG